MEVDTLIRYAAPGRSGNPRHPGGWSVGLRRRRLQPTFYRNLPRPRTLGLRQPDRGRAEWSSRTFFLPTMRARIAAFLCLVAACHRGAPGLGACLSRIEASAFVREPAR